MKYISIITTVILLSVLTISCDRDLPYPLDKVKKSVVVDVYRVSGTDGVLYAGITDGDYQVRLSIPPQQGDYSMLDYVQLMAVYSFGGQTKTVVVEDNIKELPVTINLNIKDIYQSLGLNTPQIGETLNFVANVFLKDGTAVYGWSTYGGYNNTAFTGWQIDDRTFSYTVRYAVACQLILDEFAGDMVLDDDFYGIEYDVEVLKISETELHLIGMFGEDTPVVLHINPEDYSVTIDDVIFYGTTYGPYTDLRIMSASGVVDACNGRIEFTGTVGVAQGTFGNFDFVIKY